MTPAEVIALLGFLDTLFQMGGKLVAAAMQTKPELRTDPLPTLDELDQARDEAVKRVAVPEGS